MSKEIAQSIQTWIDENRADLPVNAESWEILTRPTEKKDNTHELLLGKYNTTDVRVENFYKSFSRLILIKDEV